LAPPAQAAAAVAALVLTMGAVNAYLSGATEMLAQLTAARRAARPAGHPGVRPGTGSATRPFLMAIVATGLLLIGLYALHIVSTTGLVALPTTMFLAVYLTCTASAARILSGRTRVAAAVALIAVAGVLAFSGWALAATAVVAAAAALTATRPTPETAAELTATRPAPETAAALTATRTDPATPAARRSHRPCPSLTCR
jgi:amino acid efflux transporter